LAAIAAAKKKCVVLALDTTDKTNKYSGVSPVVARGFLNDKVGSTIPFAVISSPDQTVRYAEITYKTLSAEAQTPKIITEAVEKMATTKSAIPSDTDQLVIFSSGGRYSSLYLTEVVSDTEFKFSRQPNMAGKGKIWDTTKGNPGLRRFAKRVMKIKSEVANAERQKRIDELMPKFEAERWTNTEGKIVQATFISLIDGNITIEVPRRKNPITFPLTKLNEASQDRAKELAKKVAEAEAEIKKLGK
jgi:hypothetical protein